VPVALDPGIAKSPDPDTESEAGHGSRSADDPEVEVAAVPAPTARNRRVGQLLTHQIKDALLRSWGPLELLLQACYRMVGP